VDTITHPVLFFAKVLHIGSNTVESLSEHIVSDRGTFGHIYAPGPGTSCQLPTASDPPCSCVTCRFTSLTVTPETTAPVVGSSAVTRITQESHRSRSGGSGRMRGCAMFVLLGGERESREVDSVDCSVDRVCAHHPVVHRDG